LGTCAHTAVEDPAKRCKLQLEAATEQGSRIGDANMPGNDEISFKP